MKWSSTDAVASNQFCNATIFQDKIQLEVEKAYGSNQRWKKLEVPVPVYVPFQNLLYFSNIERTNNFEFFDD